MIDLKQIQNHSKLQEILIKKKPENATETLYHNYFVAFRPKKILFDTKKLATSPSLDAILAVFYMNKVYSVSTLFYPLYLLTGYLCG